MCLKMASVGVDLGRRRLVRRSRSDAINGCVGRNQGADRGPTYTTNREANKGGNSARRPSQKTMVRARCGANARPNGCANYQADHGMLSAPWGGARRDAGNVFAFY